MKNIKLEQQLDGDEHWPFMATVRVPGNKSAAPIPADATQPETEAIIQSWESVAVLRVKATSEVYFGFLIDDHMQYLNVPVQVRDGRFGVHVGDSDVIFFVFEKDMHSRPTLELVEVTTLDDPNYPNLPLY